MTLRLISDDQNIRSAINLITQFSLDVYTLCTCVTDLQNLTRYHKTLLITTMLQLCVIRGSAMNTAPAAYGSAPNTHVIQNVSVCALSLNFFRNQRWRAVVYFITVNLSAAKVNINWRTARLYIAIYGRVRWTNRFSLSSSENIDNICLFFLREM